MSVVRRKRHSAEQIIAQLREADGLLSGGQSIGQICQKLGVNEQTFHRWRNQYGGMKAESMKRLKQLEEATPRAFTDG